MGLWQRIKQIFTGKPKEKTVIGESYEFTPQEPVRLKPLPQKRRPVKKKEESSYPTYQSKPVTKQEIHSTIDSGSVNTAIMKLFNTTPLKPSNSGEIMSVYGSLLKGKIQDKDLFQKLTGTEQPNKDVRNLLLRDRITVNVIADLGTTSGKFDVVGLLPEEQHLLQDLVGMTISSSGWSSELKALEQTLRPFGIKKVIDQLSPNIQKGESATIKGLTLKVTFQ